MSNIDFARQLKTNSDRSSPYLGSIYSRQAKLMSPAGYVKPYQQSSKSSNKSIENYSQNHSDNSRRLVAQGYTIAHSKNESNPTDHEVSVHTHHEDGVKSPGNNFRELRKRIHEGNDFMNSSIHKKVLGPSIQPRPLPKSFKSSNLSTTKEKALKNRMGFGMTPQL